MEKLIIAANWKSNKTKQEAKSWLEEYSLHKIPENVEVILFVPYTLLDMMSAYIKVNNVNLKLGSQNVSRFPKGAHTGEIYANQIKEFADYALVGHSERRKTFGETDEVVNKKLEAAKNVGLKTLVCVSSIEQIENLSVEETLIAYEPLDAIGTGNPELPKDVAEMASKIKNVRNAKLLYGGSINFDNIKSYIEIEDIDGVLIGMDSLDVNSFIKNINNAS